jgi:hypothetical protein
MLLLIRNIMLKSVQTVRELNAFVDMVGISSHESLVAKLAESNVVVSANIARLILSPKTTVHHKQVY